MLACFSCFVQPWTPWSICEAYAEKKGYRTDRRGRPDQQRAGVELIRDCIDGILPFFFYPPDYCGPMAVRDEIALPMPNKTSSKCDSNYQDYKDSSSCESDISNEEANDDEPKSANAFGFLDESSSDEDNCGSEEDVE